MSIARANDPRAFREFIDARLAADDGSSLEDLLALWEYENIPEEQREATIRAIQRGLDDMDAGRTTDAFEFVEAMRREIRDAAKR